MRLSPPGGFRGRVEFALVGQAPVLGRVQKPVNDRPMQVGLKVRMFDLDRHRHLHLLESPASSTAKQVPFPSSPLDLLKQDPRAPADCFSCGRRPGLPGQL
jgi:hypothetical protein